MAMTKRERRALERILSNLERGIAFIDSRETFIARKASMGGAMAFSRTVTAGQVEHCLRPDDPLAFEGEQHLTTIAKDIGSELVLIRTARRELLEMLRPEMAA